MQNEARFILRCQLFTVVDQRNHESHIRLCQCVALQYSSERHEGSVVCMMVRLPLSVPLCVFSQQFWTYYVIVRLLILAIQKLSQGRIERRH